MKFEYISIVFESSKQTTDKKSRWTVIINFIVSDVVDPNRDGYVSLQEYMAFMISKETENVQSSEEIENAFRAITAGDRPYVTKEELYAVCGTSLTHLENFFL